MHHKQVQLKRQQTKKQWILLKKERLATIIKAEINFVLTKKPFTMKKGIIVFFVKFLVIASAKISIE